MPWFAGNLHCHSTFSDGDSSPTDVANWYHRNGYSFISITDHNCLTPTDEYTTGSDDFIGIPGSEYSANAERAHAHVNGYGLTESPTLPKGDLTIVEALQFGIDEINRKGGFPVINHPTRRWAFGAKEMKQLKDVKHFEVFNGTPVSNNEGDDDHQSTDEIWDTLLSEGKEIYGMASDDAHHYQNLGASPLGYMDAPGSAWIWVEIESLSTELVIESVRSGNFFATTGIKPLRINRCRKSLDLEIDPQGAKKISYTTTFIGQGGNVLSRQQGFSAKYDIQGSEGYVRAKIESSSGKKGWVQPILL
jgi:hypothetical protein